MINWMLKSQGQTMTYTKRLKIICYMIVNCGVLKYDLIKGQKPTPISYAFSSKQA